MGEEEVYRAIYSADAEELVAESRKADKALKGIKTGLDKVEKSTRTTSAKLTQFAGTLGTISGKLIKFGTLATAALGGVIGQALRASAGVEEMASRFRVTFKDMTSRTEAWSKQYAAQVGRSRFAIMKLAADYKVLLSAYGLQEKEAIKAATSLTKLTTDWESFLDIPASAVMAKVSAGLAGEAEGLRRVGVLIDAASVAQRALNEGLSDGKKELDAVTKVKLRLGIITEGLVEAQNDAIRTSRSLTNQWRALQGALEELNVSLGKVFVEDAKSAIEAMATLIRGLVAWIETNEESVRQWGTLTLKIGAAVVALGVVMKVIGLVATAAVGAAKAIGGVVAGAKAAVAAFGVLTATTGGLAAIIAAVGVAAIAAGVGLAKLVGWLVIGRRRAKEAAEELAKWEARVEHLEKTLPAMGERFERSLGEAPVAALRRANEHIQGHLNMLDEVQKRLSGLRSEYQSLGEFQKQFGAEAREAIEALAKQMMEPAERTRYEFEQLMERFGTIQKDVTSGSREALTAARELIGEFSRLDVKALAEAMGLPAEQVFAMIGSRVAQLAGQVTAVTEEQRARIQSSLKAQEKVVENVTNKVDKLRTDLERMDAYIDTKEAEKALDGLNARVTALRANLEMTARIKPPVVSPYAPTAAEILGPGRIGTPELDRLSTARTRSQPGRSSQNIVNVHAPISIRHAEPVHAMAKTIAAEINRLQRRGQIP